MSRTAMTGEFLARTLCRQVVREIERDACWQWGEINRDGRSHLDLQFRRAQYSLVPASCIPLVAGRLLDIARGLAPELGPFRGFEGPNLLRYRAGDFVRPHMDEDPANRRDRRKVTITAFLNDRGFEGGMLRLYRPGGGGALEVAPSAGRFVAFPVETMHEVTPVTAGVRYALVAWLH